MCNFGNGFTFNEIYSMPVYLRYFYYQQLVDVKQRESDEVKKAQSKAKRPKFNR